MQLSYRVVDAPEGTPLHGRGTVTNASDSAAEKKPVTAVVTLRVAGRDGPTFTLDAAVDNVIGRATEATITVPDRLASRAHAAIRYHTVRHEWILRDVGSRNGTGSTAGAST